MKRYISFLLAVLMLVTLVPTAAFADAAETDMKASDNLQLLIKGWEGLRLTAYKAHPSEEYWTIGYGHYASDIYEGMEITLEQAIDALGVKIYPIESDGFALWDAISGDNLPEVKIPVRSPERQQYYKYNQN